MEQYFLDVAALVAFTTLVAAYVNRIFSLKDQPAQIVSWLTGGVVVAIGKLLGLGFVATLSWPNTGLTAVGVALASNGVFDVEVIKQILVFLRARIK